MIKSYFCCCLLFASKNLMLPAVCIISYSIHINLCSVYIYIVNNRSLIGNNKEDMYIEFIDLDLFRKSSQQRKKEEK